MIWKTTPKTFTDEVGQERTIVGILARLVSPIDFNLEEFKELSIYLAFQTDKGNLHGERNVYTKDFELKLIAQGMPDAQAKAQVKSIIKNVCFGTVAEMYQSGAILANMYGYSILSLENQTEQNENQESN